MLSAVQLLQLEAIVRSIRTELHIEEALLEPPQTLTLVLCNDSICFRPLQITAPEIDISAALAESQAAARQVLQERLRLALQGLV